MPFLVVSPLQRLHNSSGEVLYKLGEFLRERGVLATAWRFRVGTGYTREDLRRPDASSLTGAMPKGLALELLFLCGSSKTNTDACEGIHLVTTLWDERRRTALQTLLSLPTPYVGHGLETDLAWLKFLGLEAPKQIWDLRIAQRALSLGQINVKARNTGGPGMPQQIAAEKECRQQLAYSLELTALAQAYGVHLPFKPIVQICLDIYCKQRTVARDLQVLRHLLEVEMPWVRVNACLNWHGLRIDTEKHRLLLRQALNEKAALQQVLIKKGVNSPHSARDLENYFRRHGLLELFQNQSGAVSFADNLLEAHEDWSPAIALIRRFRKVSGMVSIQESVGRHLSPTGWVHPTHRQLGTETGRQTSQDPNVLGFDRIQRNLVIPREGFGIAEADYAQQEVGVAAGLFQDPELIRLYNSGDVYSRIAQNFYAGTAVVEPGAETWTTDQFRQTYPQLRERMKVVTLSVLYGQGAFGLGQRLGVGPAEAQRFLDDFFALFPAVHRAMTEGVRESLRRGYVLLVNGLRVALDGHPSIRQADHQRMAKNYPVQGSGAIVFKTAGIRLFEAYRDYGARLLVPMHDAFVFEAPLEQLQEVTGLTCRIMAAVMKEYFPQLEPRVDVNLARHQCWTKKGCDRALEEYLSLSVGH